MPNNGLPQFTRTNIVAAIVIAAFAMGVLACQLYSPELGRLGAVISLGLIVAAGILHIPLSAVGGGVVNAPNADTVTQINNPAPPADPAPDPSPPPDPRYPLSGPATPSFLQRDPATGRFSPRIVPTKPPPLDIHADH